MSTPKGSYPETLNAIKGLVEDAESATGQTGTVGIGIPGTISPYSKKVKNANSVWLNGQPLDVDLSALLDREVRVANDANCMAVSEATDGAGKGYGVVLALILGTGAGAGIVINGIPHRGGNGIGGEWGHNPMRGRMMRNKHFLVQPLVIAVRVAVLSSLSLERACVQITNAEQVS